MCIRVVGNRGKGDYGEGVSLYMCDIGVSSLWHTTASQRVYTDQQSFKWEVQRRPLLYVSSFHFCLTSIRGCINKNMVCGMGPYAGVDFNSPFLIVNSVVSYPPPAPTQMGKGRSGEHLSLPYLSQFSIIRGGTL